MTNRTQLASGEILNGTILTVWLVEPADKPKSRGRHVAAAIHGGLPQPLFRAGGDGVPIGGKCQHRVGRDQGRQAVMITDT